MKNNLLNPSLSKIRLHAHQKVTSLSSFLQYCIKLNPFQKEDCVFKEKGLCWRSVKREKVFPPAKNISWNLNTLIIFFCAIACVHVLGLFFCQPLENLDLSHLCSIEGKKKLLIFDRYLDIRDNSIKCVVWMFKISLLTKGLLLFHSSR